LLREELDCPDGLADTSTMEWNGKTWPKVMILDPATGTGTFLETVIEVIHDTMTKKWKSERLTEAEIHAAWNEYVPEHLLPRLHGFELMMAPYSVAHMKIGLKLRETGYEFESDERLRVYLTNTLQESQDSSGRLYADFLAHEAEAANRVKREVPVTVVIGNPPFSYMAENLFEDAKKLVEPYRFVDGVRIKEKGALVFERAIQDDYVKFIAFAQTKVTLQDLGIIGMISNSAYLHNPNLRGMRNSLVHEFAHISVLDLHGDTKHDPPEDENVFDIRIGVAILLARHYSWRAEKSSVQRSDLSGSLTAKEKELVRSDISVSLFEELTPLGPNYLFTRDTNPANAHYVTWPHVDDIFAVTSVGIKTNRDPLVIAFDAETIKHRLATFIDEDLTTEDVKEKLQVKDNAQWSVDMARRKCRASFSPKHIKSVSYRPFDERKIYYHSSVVANPRPNTMKHLLSGHNLALSTNRRIRTPEHAHFFVTDRLSMAELLSSADNCNVYPLYRYLDAGSLEGDVEEGGERRSPNFSLEFTKKCTQALGLTFLEDGQGDLEVTFGPEDIFHYAYAVFHSPGYRKRYAEFLKQDFPRLPLTTDPALFSDLCQWGEELVSLHLMHSPYLNNPLSTFPQSGSNVMEKAKYDPEENRVYINKEKQYFDTVPEDIWNFRVGGYQVLDKWLKDRKGRVLSSEDIEHYRKVVTALYETHQIMQEIDEVIEAHGGWPLPGSVPAEVKG
jgi:predicted helicase